jgi:methylglutaconyl-CoA hydratase
MEKLNLSELFSQTEFEDCATLQTQLNKQCSQVKVACYQHGIWHIELSNVEQKNALSLTMRSELSSIFTHLGAIPYENWCRVVILSGQGDVFCAGANLQDMKNASQNSESKNMEDARALGRLFYQLANLNMPTISVVHGAAMGGGVGLAACTDFVLAQENSKFCLSEVSIGLVPGVISPYIVRKIGQNFATKCMLLAKKYTPVEMISFGLVEEIFGENSAQKTANDCLFGLLKQILRNGPNALRRTKLLIKKASPLPSTDIFEYSVLNIAQARLGNEGQEGLSAILEKRRAKWGVFL